VIGGKRVRDAPHLRLILAFARLAVKWLTRKIGRERLALARQTLRPWRRGVSRRSSSAQQFQGGCPPRGGGFLRAVFRDVGGQGLAQPGQLWTVGRAKEAIVAHFDETFGQDMLQKWQINSAAFNVLVLSLRLPVGRSRKVTRPSATCTIRRLLNATWKMYGARYFKAVCPLATTGQTRQAFKSAFASHSAVVHVITLLRISTGNPNKAFYSDIHPSKERQSPPGNF